MEINLKKNDNVLMKLKTGEFYEGLVGYYDGNILELSKIELNGKTFNQNLVFYDAEIESISRFEEIGKTNNSSYPNDTPNNDNISIKHRILKLTHNDFVSLKEISTNYSYIASCGKKYLDAIDDLRTSESIAVFSLGDINNYFRSLNIMVLGTPQHIYIFDMKYITTITDFVPLFTSKYVTKIVHNGCSFHYCLWKNYRIKLENVFDTQVADMHLSKSDRPLSFSKCLTKYLGFPNKFLDEDPDIDWTPRPLDKKYYAYAAQLAVYLFPLRNCVRKQFYKNLFDNQQ